MAVNTLVSSGDNADRPATGSFVYQVYISADIGQVSVWNGSSWDEYTMEGGASGVSDHGMLSGLGDDDHTQYQLRSEKGAPNGYAELDGDGLVPVEQLPEGIGGGVSDHGDLTGLADDDHTQYQLRSEKGNANGYASLDESGSVPDAQIPSGIARDSEVTSAVSDHVAAGDPHPGYRLESDNHTHASSGAQGGTIDHGVLTGLTDDDHSQYLKEKASGGSASEVPEHDHSEASEGGFGSNRLSMYDTWPQFLVGAHRGDINPDDGYPENTTRGLIEAALKGAHAVEFDVQLTSDNVFYLMHDTSVARTTNGTGNVSSKTASQMDALVIDSGYGYRSAHSGLYHPPSLAEVIEALTPYAILLYCEFKNPTLSGCTALAQQFKDAGLVRRVNINVGITNQAFAQAVKAVDPNFSVVGDSSWPESDYGINYSWSSLPAMSTVLANAPEYSNIYSPIEDYGSDQAARLRTAFERGFRGFGTDNLNQALPEFYNLMTAMKIQAEGSVEGTRPALNFIEGAGITLAVSDDSANDRVNVTISSEAVPASGQYQQFVYEVSGGDFTFITDEVGNPIFALEDLE